MVLNSGLWGIAEGSRGSRYRDPHKVFRIRSRAFEAGPVRVWEDPIPLKKAQLAV